MSDVLLTDMADRLFAQHCTAAVLSAAEHGTWPGALWDAIETAGLPAAMLPEGDGGTGMENALAILLVAARHGAPAPLAETMLASWLLNGAGLAVPAGPLTIAPVRRADRLALRRVPGGLRLCGTAGRVPWARMAGLAVLAELDGAPHVAFAGPCHPRAGGNLAGEPRDEVILDQVAIAAPSPLTPVQLRALGAAVRTVQIAGAVERCLALSVEYAQIRKQFGRPIGAFQAVQHNLAIMAGQAAAASAAADMATEALTDGIDVWAIGAAKGRASEAAGMVAGLAHQIHGAMGFTYDTALHHATRRLWSWRDEFGNEAEWFAHVGRDAIAAGPDRLWRTLSAT